MCNEYARRRSLEKLGEEFSQLRLPPLRWAGQQIPNELAGTASVRIGDVAPVFRLQDDALIGTMTPWAWKTPKGKPVFNFVSEGRDFSRSDRVLVFADGFYEFTEPAAAGVRLKDKHVFTLSGEPWFWIAGVVRDGAFTLLTLAPGPDLAPYHDRQVAVLPPREGLAWLTLERPVSDILRTPPAGSLEVATVRKDGRSLSA